MWNDDPVAEAGRIRAEIVARLAAGEFGPSNPLPPVRSLATEYGVSQETMRKVLVQLRDEGMIVTVARRGMYPAGAKPEPSSIDSIRADIRHRLRAGEWATGERLPSTYAAARRYGVSPDLVGRVYRELAVEGLVVIIPRGGVRRSEIDS